MKNIKLIFAIIISVMLTSANLVQYQLKGKPEFEIREKPSENYSENTDPCITELISNILSSGETTRLLPFTRIIGEIDYVISNPEMLIRVSGYNLYPVLK